MRLQAGDGREERQRARETESGWWGGGERRGRMPVLPFRTLSVSTFSIGLNPFSSFPPVQSLLSSGSKIGPATTEPEGKTGGWRQKGGRMPA